MSVMVLDTKIFEMVQEAICFNRSHRGEQKIFNISWDDAKRLVTKWYELNNLSYSIRYNVNVVSEPLKISGYKKIEKIDNCQFLKYLQCIHYNIEIEKPKGEAKHYIEQLERYIEALKNTIIESLTEYQEAKWSMI